MRPQKGLYSRESIPQDEKYCKGSKIYQKSELFCSDKPFSGQYLVRKKAKRGAVGLFDRPPFARLDYALPTRYDDVRVEHVERDRAANGSHAEPAQATPHGGRQRTQGLLGRMREECTSRRQDDQRENESASDKPFHDLSYRLPRSAGLCACPQ